MIEFLVFAPKLIFGIILGVFYFGGLWLTLRHLSGSRQPALFALVSFLGRSAVCISGFYLIAKNSWYGLVFSLAGFILAKLALTYRLGHQEYKELG